LAALAEIQGTSAAEPAAKSDRSPLGLVINSYWVRRDRPLSPEFPPLAEPLAFVAQAAKLGAAGVQVRVPPGNAAQLTELRAAVERHGLYLEGMVSLPKDEGDASRFEAELQALRTTGADVARTVCMSGRRYEVFDSAGQFRQFQEQAWRSLTLAEPLARRAGVRLAVENHKDWRFDEMLTWLRRLSSEHVGVCLDTGNSMALLEEPHAVVEAYAPYTLSTHIKDMGVAPADDGFLLAEVALGRGCLDLPRMFATLRKTRPAVRFNLEMITRDPLRIPCLGTKYWATLEGVSGRELADTLRRVREATKAEPLPLLSKLGHLEQLRAEAENVAASLAFADKKLRPA
jgi:sugar phosphate isomerase/epimerase